MRTAVINTNLRSYCIGNDTEFTYTFTGTYEFSKIRLNSFASVNNYSNFGIGQQDFAYQTLGSGLTTFNVYQQQLSLDNFLLFFNNTQTALNFVAPDITNPDQLYVNVNGILTLQGDDQWSPVGTGWLKLGFNIYYPTNPLATTQYAQTYYNFLQSQYIWISLGQKPDNFVDSGISTTFRVPLAGSSNFLDPVLYDVAFKDNNQEQTFSTSEGMSKMTIQLKDDNGNLLQTQNNNNTGMGVIIVFGLSNG